MARHDTDARRPPGVVRSRKSAYVCILGNLLLLLGACDPPAHVWLERRAIEAEARGMADDADPATPPATYEDAGAAQWARDSLTTAYSDTPRPGRLSGGVAAEPGDTALLLDAPEYAVARSFSRVVVPLEVRASGRIGLEIVVELFDVQLSGSGSPVVEVAALLAREDGTPVPGGEIARLTLGVRPDGVVLIDGMAEEGESLEPNGRYSRTIHGPPSDLRLEPGRYRVDVSMALEATAPGGSGHFHFARIGQARTTLQVP